MIVYSLGERGPVVSCVLKADSKAGPPFDRAGESRVGCPVERPFGFELMFRNSATDDSRTLACPCSVVEFSESRQARSWTVLAGTAPRSPAFVSVARAGSTSHVGAPAASTGRAKYHPSAILRTRR